MAIQVADCPQVGTFHMTAGRSRMLEWARPYLAPVVGAARRAHRRLIHGQRFRRPVLPWDYEVIPNGVDVERFHPDVRPFEEYVHPGRVNILFVGRLDPRKGVHHLIAAMPRLVELTHGGVQLLIVGDSYLRPKLEAAVGQGARGHVRFLGHVPSADLPAGMPPATSSSRPRPGTRASASC